MGDAIKAAEDALFGSWWWVVEVLEGLENVPEPEERLAIVEELLRAHTRLTRAEVPAAFQDRVTDAAAQADRAAEKLVELEIEIPETLLNALAPVRKARDKLLELESAAAQRDAAPAYLEAFDNAWSGSREGLLFDAGLAALARANLLAAFEKDRTTKQTLLREGARLYEELAQELARRVTEGSGAWSETHASALNRAAVAWRAAGETTRAARAAHDAGHAGGAG